MCSSDLPRRLGDGDQGIRRGGGLRGLVPRLGWTYQVGYTGESIQTNSRIQTLGTTYTSNLTASVAAPLLRGAWWGVAWTQVEVTGIQSELALEQFRESLIDIVASIEVGYWNLGARKQGLEDRKSVV